MTIREIAKALNVSPTAVSFVRNNRPGVGPENRKRIQQMLIANGYDIQQYPPPAQWKYIKFIKMRTSYQNDFFAANILDAVERYVAQAGYQLSLTNATPDTDFSALFSDEKVQIEGIIYLASSFTKTDLRKTASLPFPSIYIDFEEDMDHFYQLNTVNADNYYASYLAVRHLYSLGHRRIGYIRSLQQLGCLKQRLGFFKQHLSMLGLSILPEHMIHLDLSSPDNLEVQIWRYIKNLQSLPTAFVAENDVIAAGLLNALLISGYDVPQDISILGFDNSRISEMIRPTLTTIDVNADELAHMAVDRVLSLINGSRSPIHINVGVHLVKRSSTAPLESSI